MASLSFDIGRCFHDKVPLLAESMTPPVVLKRPEARLVACDNPTSLVLSVRDTASEARAGKEGSRSTGGSMECEETEADTNVCPDGATPGNGGDSLVGEIDRARSMLRNGQRYLKVCVWTVEAREEVLSAYQPF